MRTENLNELIDHTLLAATATRAQIAQLCIEARECRFFSVCVNPYWIADCRKLLEGSSVKVCTVVGFPLGATSSRAKAAETRIAVEAGADELDMVINVGAAKEGHWDFLEHEIHEIVSAAQGRLVKVILETAALTPEEIVQAAKRSVSAGAHYVKTSTGFGPGGATVEAVRLMRETVGCQPGVKASGGIKTRAQAEALIEAGATRIGSSSSVALITG
ncbi:MAG TPA: deoxyribose-phosphate aldolase [Candidatus Methylacidiphilales bacterium]